MATARQRMQVIEASKSKRGGLFSEQVVNRGFAARLGIDGFDDDGAIE